jgi:hypothetical protein
MVNENDFDLATEFSSDLFNGRKKYAPLPVATENGEFILCFTSSCYTTPCFQPGE